jgi:hypothetical protein
MLIVHVVPRGVFRYAYTAGYSSNNSPINFENVANYGLTPNTYIEG